MEAETVSAGVAITYTLYWISKHTDIVEDIIVGVARIAGLIFRFLKHSPIRILKAIPYLVLLYLGTQFYSYTDGGMKGVSIALVDMYYVASIFYFGKWVKFCGSVGPKRDNIIDSFIDSVVVGFSYFLIVLGSGVAFFALMAIIFGFHSTLYSP